MLETSSLKARTGISVTAIIASIQYSTKGLRQGLPWWRSGLGRSHMPQSNWARAPQLLSLRSRACEQQLLKPARLEPVLHQQEKPPQ